MQWIKDEESQKIVQKKKAGNTSKIQNVSE